MEAKRNSRLTFRDIYPTCLGVIVLILGIAFRENLIGFIAASSFLILFSGIVTVSVAAERQPGLAHDETDTYRRAHHRA